MATNACASPLIRQSRWVISFFALTLTLSFLLILERQIREHLAFREHPLFRDLVVKVPNPRYVWFAWNLADRNNYMEWLFKKEETPYPMGPFGQHALRVNASWQELCHMDSDQDGLSNGVELGDPCCRWEPGELAWGDFEIKHNLEYRRWAISHPSHPTRRNRKTHSFPESCEEEYNAEQYHRIFNDFYFGRLNEAEEDVPWSVQKIAKMGAFAFMMIQLTLWVAFAGLGDDLFRRKSPLSPGLRGLLIICSFFYMDMTSGVIHLILDHAPVFLPVLGGLSGGFRYHHEDPTAICRISWFEYASHTHLLAVVVLLELRLAPHSRGLRFFWVWGLVWSHMFQTAHRWAHFPPEELSWWKTALQNMLILSHERHMQHHQDFQKQFTILSGHADMILDPLAKLVPSWHYDYWCVFAVLWFFFPVFLDLWLICRNDPTGSLASSWVSGKVQDKV